MLASGWPRSSTTRATSPLVSLTGVSAAGHAALRSAVRPLLEDADVTVVNFATPLTD